MSDVNTMCDYVAALNADKASKVCQFYGYNPDINNPDELSFTLIEIIANNGDEATKKILSIHPDKDVILSTFANDKGRSNASGCYDREIIKDFKKYPIFAAAGDTPLTMTSPTVANAPVNTTDNNRITAMIGMQTNTILVIGIICVGAALLFKN